jgi:hypothetical protein
MRVPKPATVVLAVVAGVSACPPPGEGGGEGEGEGEGEEDWTGCPEASDHVADPGWTTTFVEARDLVRCTQPPENNDGRPIAGAFAQKLMLRLPAGTYRLPDTDGTSPYTLPLCTRRAKDGAAEGITGTGTITRDGFITATQPLAIGTGHLSVFDLAGGPTFEVCVFGDACDGDDSAPKRFMGAVCDADTTPWDTPRPQVFRRTDLTVDFDGGSLTFDVVTIVGSENPDIIGIYPIAGPLLSVRGSFNGIVVDTSDYWEMAYEAAHHVFGQYFGVVLPTPDGDTCALEVAQAVGVDPPEFTVHRLDCDFARIGELDVTGVRSEDR